MVVLPVLFLLGSLFLCDQVQAQSDTILMLKQAARMLSGLILLTNAYVTLVTTLVWRLKPYLFALLGVPLFFPVNWKGALTCEKSDCNCTFNQQRGCCCAASDMFQLEEDILERMTYLWHDISTLKGRVQSLTGKHPCLLNSKCFEAIDICCSVLILPSCCQIKSRLPLRPPWTQILPLRFLDLRNVALVHSILIFQFPSPLSFLTVAMDITRPWVRHTQKKDFSLTPMSFTH